MAKCPKCGARNDEDSDFCEKCGASLKQKPDLKEKAVQGKRKNPALAAILPLLIGVFAYLYFPNYKKFFAYLAAVIIAFALFNWAAYLLTPWMMYDCYREAKKINGEG
ncbi:MAG: zinc-ribbon domain-containing protein [Candidatus Nanoarchaeia archaeon]|nr:zinc-ribbon domain-containing protein [Candidatus Nanoarchaeia archaeon]